MKKYKIQIDKQHFDLDVPSLTGAELLALVNKTSNQFSLIQRLHGGQVKPIGPNESADFSQPGTERFNTLPLDQTEGDMRREFDLPPGDVEYLNGLGLVWETILEGNARWLLVHDRTTQPGYAQATAITALRIPSDYPDGALDMVWFSPPLKPNTGKPPSKIKGQQIDGREFQRWSRHRTPANPWRPGVDDIATQLELVDHWLRKEVA